MFNSALDREWIESSPASRIKGPGVEQSRDRVLTDDEIRDLWGVLEQLGQYGPRASRSGRRSGR